MTPERLNKFANLLSNIFNAYGSLYLSSLIVILKDWSLITSPIFVLILLFVLPLTHFFLLLKFKLISDWEISDRRQRPLFSLTALIPNIIILLIALNNTSELFVSISLSILAINIVLATVSIFWKISGHAIYLSLFFTTLILTTRNMYFILPAVIIIPLVCWSRVYLHRHSTLQVIIGSVVGILVPLMLF